MVALNNSVMQDSLRSALAINRGMEFIEKFQKEANNPPEHDHSRRQLYMNDLFTRIHRELFRDSHGLSSDPMPAGRILEMEKRGRVRDILNDFADNFFDHNGFMRSLPRDSEQLSGPRQSPDDKFGPSPSVEMLLATTYRQLQQLHPFEYGNQITLNLLMDSVGRMKGFKERYGTELDFRRLDADDLALLNNPQGNIAELSTVFAHAMDRQSPRLINNENGYPVWEDKRTVIEGIPFLKYQDEQGHHYLVTINGGLVDEEKTRAALKEHLKTPDARVSQFRVKPERYLDVKSYDYVKEQVDGGEKWVKHDMLLQDKKIIDGFRVTRDGVPLVCLDSNPLSGLRPQNHDRLLALIEQELGKGTPIFTLKDWDKAQKVLAAASGDMKSVVAEAIEHVTAVTKQMEVAEQVLFEGKHSEMHPQFFMSMGGSGAGKGGVTEIAKAYCGNNFVEASLDKSREVSDIYKVLTASGHHADDYITVEAIATNMRNWIAETARRQKINLLYDGSGIPYQGRYDKIVENYKDSGYSTMVCAVDTMFFTPPEREPECDQPAKDRVVMRATSGNDRRALPWVVTAGKHRGAFRSALDVMDVAEGEKGKKQPVADKLVVLCADGREGTNYILSESFKADIGKMNAAQKDGTLKNAIAELMHNDKTSVAVKLAAYRNQKQQANPEKAGRPPITVDDVIARIPAFEEDNVAFIGRRHGGVDSVLAVTNATRMIDFAQKGMVNSEAAGPETLVRKMRDLSFVTPTNEQLAAGANNADITLQKPPKSYTDKVAATYSQSQQR